MSEYDEYRAMPEGARITGPGKFEAELRYVPELYGMTLDGACDDTEWEGETQISVFRFTESALDETVAAYPELTGMTVRLWEDCLLYTSPSPRDS